MIVCCWSLFFGFPHACCSDEDETLATAREYQTPAGTLLKMETCGFCFDVYPHQEKHFSKTYHTRATGWPQFWERFFITSDNAFFLSVHPCEAHFESQGLQASLDTFDSECGSSDFRCRCLESFSYAGKSPRITISCDRFDFHKGAVTSKDTVSTEVSRLHQR